MVLGVMMVTVPEWVAVIVLVIVIVLSYLCNIISCKFDCILFP